MEPTEESEQSIQDSTIKVCIVGIKRMKSTHVWRLELDIYEEDSPKVKALVDQIDRDFHMLLVPIDNKPDNT
jgi:hypothetical protein